MPKGIPKSGKRKSSPRVQKVYFDCEVCGASRGYTPGMLKNVSGRFCSKSCAISHRNKANAAGKIDRKCSGCGTLVKRWPSQDSVSAYCSRACFHNSNKSTFCHQEWRAKNIEIQLEKERRWRQDNPEKVARSKAKWARRNKDWLRRNAALRRASIKVPKKEWNEAVDAMMIESCGICQYCSGQFGDDLEIDHIIPVSLGGTSDSENLTMCCRACNASKGAKLLSEWQAPNETPEFKLKKAILAAQNIELLIS